MAVCTSFHDIFDKRSFEDSYFSDIESISSDSSSQKTSESGYSPMKSENISTCTEGLGFESSDEIEETQTQIVSDLKIFKNEKCGKILRMGRKTGGVMEIPPPIWKPGMFFRCYRKDGRFIIDKIRVPVQEFLHASREDGRLRLQFLQSDDDEDDIL